MSEEKDEATVAAEAAAMEAGQVTAVWEIEGVPPQLITTPGMPERQAVRRRQARVREILHTLPPAKAQEVILDDSKAPTSCRRTRSPTAGCPDRPRP